jgi:hypothetical protein
MPAVLQIMIVSLLYVVWHTHCIAVYSPILLKMECLMYLHMSDSLRKKNKRYGYIDDDANKAHSTEFAGAGRKLLELILIISIPFWLSITIISILLLQMTGGIAGAPFLTGIVITASIMYMVIIRSMFQQEPEELQGSRRTAAVWQKRSSICLPIFHLIIVILIRRCSSV